MLENILQNLWYKDLEIKIFLCSASLGISPASTIAKKTGIKRTTCYQILEQLCQKRIVKRHLKAKMKFYEAITLDELSAFLKSSINDLQKNYSDLEQNKQDLEKLYQKNIWDTQISFYEWFDDIKLIYDWILDADDNEIYSLTNRDFVMKKHPLKEYWDKYFLRRIVKNKYSYTISSKQEWIPEIETNENKFRKTLKIPDSEISVYWDIKVSWNTFAIVSQHEWRIFWVTIENEWIAKMFKSLIKEVWNKHN